MSKTQYKLFKGPVVFIIGLFFIQQVGFGQKSRLFEDVDSISSVRFWGMTSVASAGTGMTLGLLGNQWYNEYETVPFHFFNDNDEWLQMDKLGHGLTAFYGGLYGYNALKWTGLSKKNSLVYGGIYGFGFLLATEIMDGFSSGWGASGGDLISNTIGGGLFITQQAIWDKQIVSPKFSYFPTEFAQYRPNLLGDSPWNKWLKDYNGQTYWLSFSLSDFKVKSKFLPKWLALAIGYGATGMLGGSFNPEINDEGQPLPHFKRSREYYLSLDLNFQNIKTKSAFFNTILKGISFVKFPAPAIKLNEGKLSFLPIHY